MDSITFDFEFISKICKSEYQTKIPSKLGASFFLENSENGFKYQPQIILWDPLQQYHQSLHCPFHHTSLLHTGKWTDSIFRKPRKLYDLGGVVYLCSAYYKCSDSPNNGLEHTLIASDEGLLSQIESCKIPFLLTKKSGSTAQFRAQIVQRIMEGNKFEELEKSLADTAAQQINLSLLQFSSSMKKNFTFKQIELLTGSLWPSDRFLQDVFLCDFRTHQHIYREQMEKITANTISMDHTFKVSSNIGYTRDDGTWVPLYNNLFIILNEFGQVLDFKFTKSTAFEHVNPLLSKLKERLLCNGTNNLLAIIDNCCHWEKKLKCTMSPIDVDVKLDLFHAISRVTSTIPVGTACRYEFINDFKLIVRKEHDYGKKRMQTTPTTEELKDNLKQFLLRWKDKKTNEQVNIASPITLQAINKLAKHICKGCLSDIPVGCGTNRNERLHRLLNNSALCVSKIGPEVAEAILCVTFYKWNANKLNIGQYKPVLPISYFSKKQGNLYFNPGNEHINLDREETVIEGTELSLLYQIKNFVDVCKLICNPNLKPDIVALTNITLFPELSKKVLFCQEDTKNVLAKYGYTIKEKCNTLSELISIIAPMQEIPLDLDENLETLLQRMCNWLNITLIIFCGSNDLIPFQVFVPQNVFSEKVIVLACQEEENKTFFYLTEELPRQQSSTTNQLGHKKGANKSCRCGEGQKTNNSKCVKSRCPCFSNGRSCSSKCSCKLCDNKFGQRPKSLLTFTSRKKKHESIRRVPYLSGQNYLLTNSTAPLKSGKWSCDETMLIVLIQNGLAIVKRDKRQPTNIEVIRDYTKYYQSFSKRSDIQIHYKSPREITGKLTHLKKKKNELTILMK